MSKSNSMIVLVKPLAFTAGIVGFFVTFLGWYASGRLALEEEVYLISVNFGFVLAVISSLGSRFGKWAQGGMAIGSSLLILAGWTYGFSKALELAAPAVFIFALTGVILAWSIIVLLTHESAGVGGQSEIEH